MFHFVATKSSYHYRYVKALYHGAINTCHVANVFDTTSKNWLVNWVMFSALDAAYHGQRGTYPARCHRSKGIGSEGGKKGTIVTRAASHIGRPFNAFWITTTPVHCKNHGGTFQTFLSPFSPFLRFTDKLHIFNSTGSIYDIPPCDWCNSVATLLEATPGLGL